MKDKTMATKYNKTQLHPELAFERHVFHRDMFAHFLRWTHVLKTAKIGMNILDFGCGNANMLEVFYRNRYKPKKYLGIDIRKQTINKLKEKYAKLDYAEFLDVDLCSDFNVGDYWDIIGCFEVIEHIGLENVDKFLQNIRKCMNENTILLISTPVYDQQVGPAKNHIINGKRSELTYNEMFDALNRNGLKIIDKFGTFASIKDYKHELAEGPEWKELMFEHLTKYYDSNLVSVLMAPFFPKQSRNILWRVMKQ